MTLLLLNGCPFNILFQVHSCWKARKSSYCCIGYIFTSSILVVALIGPCKPGGMSGHCSSSALTETLIAAEGVEPLWPSATGTVELDSKLLPAWSAFHFSFPEKVNFLDYSWHFFMPVSTEFEEKFQCPEFWNYSNHHLCFKTSNILLFPHFVSMDFWPEVSDNPSLARPGAWLIVQAFDGGYLGIW